jgi:hypothetical protein
VDDAPSSTSLDEGSADLTVALDARPVVVPLEHGRLEVHFAQLFGTVRAHLTFIDRPTPAAAVLRVPALGGALDVPCQPHEERLVSTRAVATLPPGTQLAFAEDGRWHRFTLWNAR